MHDLCYVGIDTSNYTTSAAVCDAEGRVIANLKAPLPVKAGECGLRQSDAVFAHVKNLPRIMEELRLVLRGSRVAAVGVSVKPRNAEGSYMPCFLAGKGAAEALAAGLDVPVREFSHQDGHVMAAVYSSGGAATLTQGSFGAFHVSGGTTEMLFVSPTQEGFDVVPVGETNDLNAGQAIDRAGVMMGLDFPCGKEMESLAREWQGQLPPFRVSVRDGKCNLSGLQNLAEKLWRESGDRGMVSAFVFAFIGKTLTKMTAWLDERYGSIPIVYAGGVMSNRYLQSVLGKRANTFFAEPAFSADNAAGIALLCKKSFDAKENLR